MKKQKVNLESEKSMNNYSNAYAEVYTILEYLDEEEKNKIPQKVLNAIEQSRNKDYIFDLEDDIELQEQILLPETRAILYNLFRDYLAEPWQKEKIIEMQKDERQKNEELKKEKYDVEIFSKENNIQDETSNEEVTELMEYNENIFKKIWGFLKNLFM